MIEDVPEGVLAFTRKADKDSVTVYANLTPNPVEVTVDGAKKTIEAWGWILE